MAAAAKGAGLVFLNNPNNPTATVHGSKAVADFVQKVRAASPDTVILIDEAYHDYVTDPSYESAIPLAMQTPNVFVARTFSKAYGMAGLRIGYAIGHGGHDEADGAAEDALQRQRLRRRRGDGGVCRHRSTSRTERARNTEVRAFTVKALDDLGCKSSDSQGNFLFVETGPAGRRVPRRLRQAGDHGGPAVPAAREDARAHLARHDGRDEESHGRVPQRAPAGDDDRRQE